MDDGSTVGAWGRDFWAATRAPNVMSLYAEEIAPASESEDVDEDELSAEESLVWGYYTMRISSSHSIETQQ